MCTMCVSLIVIDIVLCCVTLRNLSVSSDLKPEGATELMQACMYRTTALLVVTHHDGCTLNHHGDGSILKDPDMQLQLGTTAKIVNLLYSICSSFYL